MPSLCGGGAGLVLYDLDVHAELASRCRVEAWTPQVPGIREVFHAHLVDYAYPAHRHDTWSGAGSTRPAACCSRASGPLRWLPPWASTTRHTSPAASRSTPRRPRPATPAATPVGGSPSNLGLSSEISPASPFE